jgi:hypothetical protein
MEYLLNFVVLLLVISLIYWKYHTRAQQEQHQHNEQHHSNNNNHQYPIKSINNPFFIDIDTTKSSLDNGIFFKLIVNIKCHFIVAWSIDINKFYQDLDKNFKEKFHDTNLLINNSMIISKNEIIENNLNELKEYHLKTPDKVKEIHLASINSIVQKYPLIIALYRTKDNLDDNLLNETDIVANLWIIHLKDTKTNTKTLFIYSKCLNDKIIHIKVRESTLLLLLISLHLSLSLSIAKQI